MYNGSTRLLDQFIVHISVERGLARATVRAYESDLRRYLSWLAHTRGIIDPDAIGKADIEEYVAQLDSDGDSARSKARRLASIHEFHRFALAQHAVSDDVSATVKAPKSAQRSPACSTRFPTRTAPARRGGELAPERCRTPCCCVTGRCSNSCTPPDAASPKRSE